MAALRVLYSITALFPPVILLERRNIDMKRAHRETGSAATPPRRRSRRLQTSAVVDAVTDDGVRATDDQRLLDLARPLRLDTAVGGEDNAPAGLSPPSLDNAPSSSSGWSPSPSSGWAPLNVAASEMRLAATLLSGQSFRWQRRLASADGATSARAQFPADIDGLAELGEGAHVEYVGPVEGHLYVLRETDADVFYRVASAASAAAGARDVLRRYLRLPPAGGAAAPNPQAVLRSSLDASWKGLDAGLERRLEHFPGVRLLGVPLFEAIITFVGSANNNIKRNSQMIASLCAEFEANALGSVGGERYFSFPSPEQLATVWEERLWELGWGYRAPRVAKLCPQLAELGGAEWLASLRSMDRTAAREELCKLSGIGRKVADCIILFSLSIDDCIPVDTHCWQFMSRAGYLPKLKKAAGLNPVNYELIGDCLRERFGARAGWAFMVLFTAEVHPFRVALEQGVVFHEQLWFGGVSDTSKASKAGKASKASKASKAERKKA